MTRSKPHHENAEHGFAVIVLLVFLIPILASRWLLVSTTPSAPTLVNQLNHLQQKIQNTHRLDLVNVHLSKSLLHSLDQLNKANTIHFNAFQAYKLLSRLPANKFVLALQSSLLLLIRSLKLFEDVFQVATIVQLTIRAKRLCKKNSIGTCLPIIKTKHTPVPLPMTTYLGQFKRVRSFRLAPGYLRLKTSPRATPSYRFAILPLVAFQHIRRALQGFLESGQVPFFEHVLACLNVTFSRRSKGLRHHPPDLRARASFCPPSTWISNK